MEKAKNIIKSVIRHRFGALDEALSSVIEPLEQMPDDEIAGLLLTSSQEELLARFGQDTIH